MTKIPHQKWASSGRQVGVKWWNKLGAFIESLRVEGIDLLSSHATRSQERWRPTTLPWTAYDTDSDWSCVSWKMGCMYNMCMHTCLYVGLYLHVYMSVKLDVYACVQLYNMCVHNAYAFMYIYATMHVYMYIICAWMHAYMHKIACIYIIGMFAGMYQGEFEGFILGVPLLIVYWYIVLRGVGRVLSLSAFIGGGCWNPLNIPTSVWLHMSTDEDDWALVSCSEMRHRRSTSWIGFKNQLKLIDWTTKQYFLAHDVSPSYL